MSEKEPIHIISLGAGVQSSTMALMAAAGEITPLPVAAIFADTQAEPKSVYAWLDWLEKQLPFPVHRVTRGNWAEMALRVRTSRNGNRYTKHNPPAFIKDETGKVGLMNRQCTGDFKLDVIHRKMRGDYMERLKSWYRDRRNLPSAPKPIIQWIGISSDEASRMKPARRKWIENRWPLIELNMSRHGCARWLSQNYGKSAPRSACMQCPYHNDSEWRRMKTDRPDDFAYAVDWEKRFQATMAQSSELRGTVWLHRLCVPLSEIDFDKSKEPELNLFNNECEGHCGV